MRMRTVKEVSEVTGISVRTLHYYDEIGLFQPSRISEGGYRLYDDKALETLQQILFFREFDMPLKQIKTIMDDPALDRTNILKSQRKMLELKKDRLANLIFSIDQILKGENKMNFEVFSKAEIEELYQKMISNMPEAMKEAVILEYGELDKFHDHYIENASGEKAQENYKKLVEWYGDKESVLNSANNPADSKLLQSYESRLDAVMKKLAVNRDKEIASFEVKSLIGEYGFIFRQLYQMKDEKALMLEMAAYIIEEERMKEVTDQKYGEGMAEFFHSAVIEFYRE